MNKPSEELSKISLENLYISKENENDHSPEQISALARNIERFGFDQPLSVLKKSDRSYEIIKGAGRYQALQKLGIKFAPCIVHTDLSDEEIKLLRVSDNQLQRISSWNIDNLKSTLSGIDDGQVLELTGFTELDLQEIRSGEFEVDSDIKEELETAKEPKDNNRFPIDFNNQEEKVQFIEYLQSVFDSSKHGTIGDFFLKVLKELAKENQPTKN